VGRAGWGGERHAAICGGRVIGEGGIKSGTDLRRFGMKRLAVLIAMYSAPAALLAQAAVRAPTDSVSAPIRDVRYELRFMRANAEQGAIDVTMSFATTTA